MTQYDTNSIEPRYTDFKTVSYECLVCTRHKYVGTRRLVRHALDHARAGVTLRQCSVVHIQTPPPRLINNACNPIIPLTPRGASGGITHLCVSSASVHDQISPVGFVVWSHPIISNQITSHHIKSYQTGQSATCPPPP